MTQIRAEWHHNENYGHSNYSLYLEGQPCGVRILIRYHFFKGKQIRVTGLETPFMNDKWYPYPMWFDALKSKVATQAKLERFASTL